MRNYLSQIAHRASGMAETDYIKPASQGWPVGSAEAVPDPFEQIEFVKSSPAQVPEKNAEPLTADRISDDVVLPDTPGQEKRTSDTPGPSYVSSEQPTKLFEKRPVRLSPRLSPDFTIAPLPREKEGEIIEQPAQDQSDRLPPHRVPESSTASDVEYVSPETDQPVPRDGNSPQSSVNSHQPIGDSRPETGDFRLATQYQYPASSIQHQVSPGYPSTEAGQTDRNEREPVSELRPRPPINPVTSPVYKKDSQEKRMVIGRLKVEVVKPPPVITQKRAVRTAPRRQQRQRESGVSRSRLRFGLGQM